MPSKKIAAARAAAGLCVTCGINPPTLARVFRNNRLVKRKPKRTCAPCRIKAKLRAALRRKSSAKAGTCEACMRRKRVPGLGNRCRKCHAKYGTHNTHEVA